MTAARHLRHRAARLLLWAAFTAPWVALPLMPLAALAWTAWHLR